MALLDKISSTEFEAMEAYINAYGAKNEDEKMKVTVPYVLRFWEKSKEEFLSSLFGDKLIISKTLNFEKNFEELEDDMRRKITDSYYSDTAKECEIFFDEWRELTKKLGVIDEDKDPWEEGKYNDIYWEMNALTGLPALSSNHFSGNSVDIPLPNDKKYRLLPGAKTSKAIGKIATAYDLKGYERFRILHSQVLNEKSLSGEVCLSIHPLDYMTMSDNDCGWSSCMSWSDHGDFRQGTVEMMNSPCVVVAYLKSATDFPIPGGYIWNSKRWRQLFIVTPEIITAIKGYPYWNETLEKAVLDWIKELIDPTGEKFEDNISSYNRNCIGDININFHTKLMYNDLYSTHQTYIAKDHSVVPRDIMYSGVTECLCCGEDMSDNYSVESDLFCNSCDETYQCYECGDYHSLDDLIEVDGILYCEYCFNNVIQECPECGNVHYYENFNRVYIAKDDDHIFEFKYFDICNDCIDYVKNMFNGEKIKTVWTSPWRQENYILIEDLTEEGKDYINYTGEYNGPLLYIDHR